MAQRNKARDRCEKCRMRSVLCLCALVPRLELRTRVTVLMHWREERTTTNTGRIATLALPNSEIRICGGGLALPAEGLLREGEQPALLFPYGETAELTPDWVAAQGKPVHLVVPDGTWRQARRMVLKEPLFEGVPRVRLPGGGVSVYRLRRTLSEENISTLEAIARALAVLESPDARDRLEALFEVMVERVLWSRGKLRLEELKHGRPEEALRAFHADGCRSQCSD